MRVAYYYTLYDIYILNIIIGCGLAVTLVVLVFNNIAYKNIFKNKYQQNRMKYGFYECGFKSRKHLMLEFPINAYLMCILTIIYNAECIFIILAILNIQLFSLTCLALLIYYMGLFFLGISLDTAKGVLFWHYH